MYRSQMNDSNETSNRGGNINILWGEELLMFCYGKVLALPVKQESII